MDIPRAPSPHKKLWRSLWIGGGVVGLAAATYGLSQLEPAAPPVDESTILTDSVRQGLMVRSVRGPGTLIPERVRFIAAVAGGRVEAIHVQPGDQVEPETVLIELANPDVELQRLDAYRQLAQAEAELANLQSSLNTQRLAQEGAVAAARAAWREAERQAEASRELASRNLIARMDLALAEDQAAETAERLRVAEEQLEVLDGSIDARLQVQESQAERLRSIVEFQEERFESMRVRAGSTGVVQELALQIGQWVMPGTTLTRVVEPGRLNALLRVPETQVRDVVVGQGAVIDMRVGVSEGRVIRIEPSVQAGAVAVEVLILGALPDLPPKAVPPRVLVQAPPFGWGVVQEAEVG